MDGVSIRIKGPDDTKWIEDLIEREWGSLIVVTRGKIHKPTDLSGFIALENNFRVGLVTYRIHDTACEIVTLNSLVEGIGAGTALLDSIINIAREKNCIRVWLTTTNDNRGAIEFYQRRGFSLYAIHSGAIVEARKLKPEIPMNGIDGIPIIDEIEFEMILTY